MPSPTIEVMQHAGVPHGQIAQPLGRLFVLLCQRYDLDPALRQLEVINTKNGLRCYITADGYRHIALASGELDGIEILDTTEGVHGWSANVRVFKKDCTHGFDGRAGCGFDEKKDDPEAQALTRATRRALRNAFDPVRVEAEYQSLLRDSDTEDAAEPGALPTAALSEPAPPAVTTPGSAALMSQSDAHRIVFAMSDADKAAFAQRHGIERVEAPFTQPVLEALSAGER